MMKVFMVFVFLCTYNAYAHIHFKKVRHSSLHNAYAHMDFGSNGVSKEDQYGDNWQKAPTKNEVDPSPKKCFNDLNLFDMLSK